jgi:mono/diheme cytochrome c family protein
MSYTSNVSPIMTDNCVSCHSGGAPAGNIPLETYSEVKVQADNGKLLGSIKHEAGYSPMPKNQSQLSECDVNKIEAWINQGTKN